MVAAACGFVALSYEIVWYRTFAFAGNGSPAVFGLLLGFYLFGLANGASRARAYCSDHAAAGTPGPVRALFAWLLLAQVASYLVVPALARLATVTKWTVALFPVAVAATLLGGPLPLLSHAGIAADDRAGARLSYLYVANIAGSAAGSLLTGFVLLDLLPLRTLSLVLLVAGLVVTAAVLPFAKLPPPRARLALAGLLAGLGLAALAPQLFDQLYERLLYKRAFHPGMRFAQVVENRSGVITVSADGRIYGGGAYDGVFNTRLDDDRNSVVRAYALGALHPAPRRVLMVGLASGSWAQVVAHLPGVEDLTVVEINPGYVALIAAHPEVAGLLSNPRVHLVTDDGRRWLQRHPGERFDAVVMNTTWHWRAHVTDLLSREFLEIVRTHLRPGGIFLYNTTSSPDALRTGAITFPYAMRVYNCLAVSDAPLVFDRARWERVLTETLVAGHAPLDLARPEGRALLARLRALPDTLDGPPRDDGLERRESLLARTRHATIVTDDNMATEWHDPLALPITH
jgi:predicted membrane-bound spermidine synthase